MIAASITTKGLDEVARAFDKMARGQVPFATSLAINRVAELSIPALKSNMAVVFDRPKPYTMNSLFVKRSTKHNLTARVFHSSRVAPYLRAEIEGGSRQEKGFEVRISGARGVLVPTKNAPRDSYGGVSRAFLTKVLSQARSVGARSEYVIVRPGEDSKLSPGVYHRKDGRICALFLFKDRTTYEPRYDMLGVVQRVIQAEFGRQFSASMDFALSTAKLKLV